MRNCSKRQKVDKWMQRKSDRIKENQESVKEWIVNDKTVRTTSPFGLHPHLSHVLHPPSRNNKNLATTEGPSPPPLRCHLHWPQKPRPGGCTDVDVNMSSGSSSSSGTDVTVSNLPVDGILSSCMEQSDFYMLYPAFMQNVGIRIKETRPCQWPGSRAW